MKSLLLNEVNTLFKEYKFMMQHEGGYDSLGKANKFVEGSHVDENSIIDTFYRILDDLDKIRIIHLNDKNIQKVDAQRFMCYDGERLYIGDRFYKYPDKAKACLFIVEWLNYMTCHEGGLGMYSNVIVIDMRITKHIRRASFPRINMLKLGTIIYANCFRQGSRGEIIYSTETMAKCIVRIPQVSVGMWGWRTADTIVLSYKDTEKRVVYDFNNNLVVYEHTEKYKEFEEEVEVFEKLAD